MALEGVRPQVGPYPVASWLNVRPPCTAIGEGEVKLKFAVVTFALVGFQSQGAAASGIVGVECPAVTAASDVPVVVAVLGDGSALGWGSNDSGQLGPGVPLETFAPFAIPLGVY